MKFESFEKSPLYLIKMYRDYDAELRQFDPDLAPFTLKEFGQKVLDNPNIRKLLISDEEDIVGFILLQHVSDIIDSPAWYIVDFYIRPPMRKKGLGTKAFEHFLKSYPGDFFFYVLKKNSPAREFWGSCIKRNELIEVNRPDLYNYSNAITYCIERR